MTVSTAAYLKGHYDAARAIGAKAISSDFAFEIEGFEQNWLLCKQAPWPEISPAGEIEVPMPLGSTAWQPQQVKIALGLGLSSWETFVTDMRQLAERKVNKFEAMNYLINVLGDRDTPLNQQSNTKAIDNVYALFSGQGKGSDLVSASGTAWGLLNGVTEYVDRHRRARSPDHRLDSAWFGPGAAIKEKAFHEALKLAA